MFCTHRQHLFLFSALPSLYRLPVTTNAKYSCFPSIFKYIQKSIKKNQKIKPKCIKFKIENRPDDGTTDAAKPPEDSPRIEGNGDTTPSHAADSTSSAKSKKGADKHYLSGTFLN